MKIKSIIEDGEMLTGTQLAEITGGTQAVNTNVQINCHCDSGSTDTNSNKAQQCSCSPTAPPQTNTQQICK